MARRPRARVDTSRLRAMGETSAVVARPVDTYVRPAAPQKNEQYAQILSALSIVNPALDNFITDKVTKDREKQANLGEKSFYEATPEERKAMSAKIRSGEINELQSPFWVEGFARQLLRNHASTFGSALTLEWNKKKDSGGFDFNAFVAEERGKYVEANNLSSFRSDLFNDEFAAVTQTYERQVQQRNFEHRISQAKKARMRAWSDGMVGILEGVQTTINDKTFFDPIGGEESDSKGSLDFSGQINAHVQAIIDQGQDPKEVVQMAQNFLIGTSERLATKGDGADAKTILRMLYNLKLNVGTFGIVYKDRFAQAERNVTQLTDASEKRQDEDDEKKGENRIGELFDDMQKAGYEAEWSQEWWDSTQDDRNELQRLNQEYGGSQGSALNDLYTNRGKVTRKTDPLVISELVSDITDPKEVLDSKDIRAMAEVAGLTPRETADLITLNNNLDEQLLNDLGLDTIRSDLKNSVMGANTSGGFGPNPERARISGDAVAELNGFIRLQLTRRSALTDTEIATSIQAKADALLQKYSNMTPNVSGGSTPIGSASNPLVQPPPSTGTEDGEPIVPATLEQVQSFIRGKLTPHLKPNGEFDTTFYNLDLLKAYAKAANNTTQDASKTELGKKIAYLVAGGHATPNEILAVLTADYEKAKSVSTEAAAEAVVEADNAASTRSTREPVSASKFAEELVDRGTELVSELISGDEAEETAPELFNEPPIAGTGRAGLAQRIREDDALRLLTAQEAARSTTPMGISPEQYDANIVSKADQKRRFEDAAAAASNSRRLLTAQEAARSTTPMGISPEQYDANTVSEADQKRRFEDAAMAASNSRRLLAEQEAARELKRENQRRQASGAEVPPSILMRMITQEQYDAMSVDAQQKADQQAIEELVQEKMRRQASGAEVPPSIRRNLRTQEELDAISIEEQQKVLQKLRLNEAKQLSALEAEADKAAAAADLKRLNAKKQRELRAEIARKREQEKQEFLKRQSLMQSKRIAKFIAERAEKFPEKFGVTMSDDLDSYLAKTKPLWFTFWDGLLPDGQEIPNVFYGVIEKEFGFRTQVKRRSGRNNASARKAR